MKDLTQNLPGFKPRFWQVALAFLFDVFFATVGLFIVCGTAFWLRPQYEPHLEGYALFAVDIILTLIISGYMLSCIPMYPAILHASILQATFGKLLVGLYITDGTGRRLSIGKSILRQMAYFQYAGSIEALQKIERNTFVRSRF
jgi:uncharacterized RDD family membrane protein YckC